MRRLARRLFAPCSAASLLLWAAVCVLWVRSHGDFDTVCWYDNQWQGPAVRTHAYGVSADSGGVMFFTMNRRADFAGDAHGLASWRASSPPFRGFHHHRLEPCGYPYMDPEYAGWRLLGFGYFAGTRTPPILSPADHDRYLVVPFALVAALTAALPLAWSWRRLRLSFRTRHGLCPTCGYDVRASPGRCPECGRSQRSREARGASD
jgi:hypothetical protein